MTTVASAIIANASTLLQDTTNVRWPTLELLAWLNEGQREIAAVKPNASITHGNIALIGGTKQTLPTGAISLIEIIRNRGSSGVSEGNAVRLITREILDAQIPDWHSVTATLVVKHYMYSPLSPRTFYVYPPMSSTAYVEGIYVSAPTDAATVAANIGVDDIYAPALLNYVMYRAHSKEAEYTANAALATAYYQTFQAQLGMKVTAESATNPNSMLGNPNIVKAAM